MIKVVFKNLEKSTLAEEIVLEKLNTTIQKFPELSTHSIHVTLFMNNSNVQAGADEFGVKLLIRGKKFARLILEKRAKSLYLAMALTNESLLELLNRRTDKLRVTSRLHERELSDLAHIS